MVSWYSLGGVSGPVHSPAPPVVVLVVPPVVVVEAPVADAVVVSDVGAVVDVDPPIPVLAVAVSLVAVSLVAVSLVAVSLVAVSLVAVPLVAVSLVAFVAPPLPSPAVVPEGPPVLVPVLLAALVALAVPDPVAPVVAVVAAVVEVVAAGLVVVESSSHSTPHPSPASYAGASPLHAGPAASIAASTKTVEPMLPVRTRLERSIGSVRRLSRAGTCKKAPCSPNRVFCNG